jgi:hypothetical protein
MGPQPLLDPWDSSVSNKRGPQYLLTGSLGGARGAILSEQHSMESLMCYRDYSFCHCHHLSASRINTPVRTWQSSPRTVIYSRGWQTWPQVQCNPSSGLVNRVWLT